MEASLVYIVSSRKARATQRSPVSRTKHIPRKGLHGQLEGSLSCLRPCLKKEKKGGGGTPLIPALGRLRQVDL